MAESVESMEEIGVAIERGDRTWEESRDLRLESEARVQAAIDQSLQNIKDAEAAKLQAIKDSFDQALLIAQEHAEFLARLEAERIRAFEKRKERVDAQIANAKRLADIEIAEARRVAAIKIAEEQRVQGIYDTLRGRFKLDQQEALQQTLAGSLTSGEALGNLQSLLELRARTALSTDRRAIAADVNVGAAGSLLGLGNNTSGSGLDIVSQLGALPSSFEAVIQALARVTGQQVQISMAPGAGDMIVAEVVNSQLNGAEL